MDDHEQFIPTVSVIGDISIDVCVNCGDIVVDDGYGVWSHYRGAGSRLRNCQHTAAFGHVAEPSHEGRYFPLGMVAPPAAQTPPDDARRRLPGDTTPCERCGRPIVWSVTVARENGPGGKAMPLDAVEHPDGNVAASPAAAGRWLARVMKKDESPIVPVEYRAMPHFATCGKGDSE